MTITEVKKMLKKTMGIMILVVFMLSIVPLAIADNENSGHDSSEDYDLEAEEHSSLELAGVDVDSSLEVKIGDDKESDSDKESEDKSDVEDTEDTDEKESEVEVETEVETESETEVEDSSNENESEIAERLREKIRVRVDSKIANIKAKVTAEVVRELAEKFKEKHEQSKEALEEHRAVLLRLNNAVKNCDDSDVCLNAKSELRLGAKVHLLRTLDVIESWLERTANEGSDDAALLLENLAEVKLHVEALTAENTVEDYNAAIAEVRALWLSAKEVQKEAVGAMIQTKTEATVNKYLGVTNSMQVRVENIARLGGDTDKLTEIMEKYQTLINEVETKKEDAKSTWQEAESRADAYGEWKADHEEIQSLLVDARELVREFVSEYTVQAKLTGNIEVDDDSAQATVEGEATVE